MCEMISSCVIQTPVKQAGVTVNFHAAGLIKAYLVNLIRGRWMEYEESSVHPKNKRRQ